MNRWKFAFFIQLVISLVTIGFLAYVVVDQSVSITYGRVGRADVTAHRDILDALLRGRISKAEIQASGVKVLRDESNHSYEVDVEDISFQFDPKGMYKASSLGGSSTNDYLRSKN